MSLMKKSRLLYFVTIRWLYQRDGKVNINSVKNVCWWILSCPCPCFVAWTAPEHKRQGPCWALLVVWLLSRSHTPEDQDGDGDGWDDHDEDDCDDGHGNCNNDHEDAHLKILGFEIVTSSRFSARPEVLASVNCNWLCFVVFSCIWFYLVVFGCLPCTPRMWLCLYHCFSCILVISSNYFSNTARRSLQ